MNPDMKRLVSAASTVKLSGKSIHDTNAQIYEAIVRAVLMELREVSIEARSVAADRYPVMLDTGHVQRSFRDMLDYILAEPAMA